MLAEAGQYFVRQEGIINSGVAKAKEKESHYFFIEFQTQHIAGNGAWVPLKEPLTRTLMFSLTEKALPYTEQKLEHLGFNGDFTNPQYSKIRGGFHVVCDHRPDQKKPSEVRENWDLLGWGDGEQERPEPDQAVIDQLTARWKHNHEQAAPPVGQPAAPPANPAPTTQQPTQSAPAPAPAMGAPAQSETPSFEEGDDPLALPPK